MTTATRKTWTYGGCYKVAIAAGVVVESDAPSYPVGMAIRPGQMTACGWKTVRPAAQYYGRSGRKADGRRFAE